jgi:hypothetical protein
VSDNLFAYYDADRDAVILRLESGSEVSVLDRDDAHGLAREIMAASLRQSTGYEEYLAQETGDDTDEPDTDAVPYPGYASDDPRYDEAAQQEFEQAAATREPESTFVVLARFLVQASSETEASGQVTTDLSAHRDVDEVWVEAQAD